MKQLLRNSTHGNGVFLYYMEEKGTSFFRKASYDSKGISFIKNELEGWEWYQKMSQRESFILNSDIHSYFCSFDVKKIVGKRLFSWKGLSLENMAAMEIVLKHYVKVWSNDPNELVALHGDLSLENVILNEGEVTIFDWEHFRPHCVPLGFDVLYLLFETIWFSNSLGQSFSADQERFVENFFNEIVVHCDLSQNWVKAPLLNIIDFMHNNRQLWKVLESSFKRKFPILGLDSNQISYMQNLLKT